MEQCGDVTHVVYTAVFEKPGLVAARCSASPCRLCRGRMAAMPDDGCVFVVDDDEAVRDSLSALLDAG